MQITSPLDSSNLPNPSTAGQQAPLTDLGVNKATEISAPDVGKAADKAADKAGDVADSLPSPGGNPIDSIKGLFGQ